MAKGDLYLSSFMNPHRFVLQYDVECSFHCLLLNWSCAQCFIGVVRSYLRRGGQVTCTRCVIAPEMAPSTKLQTSNLRLLLIIAYPTHHDLPSHSSFEENSFLYGHVFLPLSFVTTRSLLPFGGPAAHHGAQHGGSRRRYGMAAPLPRFSPPIYAMLLLPQSHSSSLLLSGVSYLWPWLISIFRTPDRTLNFSLHQRFQLFTVDWLRYRNRRQTRGLLPPGLRLQSASTRIIVRNEWRGRHLLIYLCT